MSGGVTSWVYEKMLPYATAPAIVRAHQKDDYFINDLNKKVADLVKLFTNSRFLITNKDNVEILSKFLYMFVTTVFGVRTLGEEYVNLSYIDAKGRRKIGFLKRILFVVTYVLVPFILSKLMKIFTKDVEHSSNKKSLIFKIKKILSKLTFISLVDAMNLHLALFYMSGKYYQISKRLFGMRYAFNYVPNSRSRQANGNYELLGGAMIIQLIIKYGNLFRKYANSLVKDDKNNDLIRREQKSVVRKAKNGIYYDMIELKENQEEENGTDKDKGAETEAESESENNSASCTMAITVIDLEDKSKLPYIKEDSRTCMLCLSPMRDPSCASCGHVFCWGCIMEWCKERNECPLCRNVIRQQQTLPLR